MEIKVLESADNPEEQVCKAARNDYEERWVGDTDFEDLMNGMEPADDVPSNALKAAPDKRPEDLTRRMWTLIVDRLLDHGHFGPFEHPHITIAVEGVSRSLMAQITRHRPGITFDVQSMRYVNFEDANPTPGEATVLIPELDDPGICGRHAEFAEEWEDVTEEEILLERQRIYEEAMRDSFEKYNQLIALGTAPENARMVLPIGTKVNLVFTLNARTLMHIADMRAAGDAQWEVRAMTDPSQIPPHWDLGDAVPEKGVLDVAQEWMPLTFTYYREEMQNRKNRLAP